MTPDEGKARAAAERAETLLNAFKYIIKMPGQLHAPDEFCRIEEIISGDRRDLFWDKWHNEEPIKPKDGFFVSYIRRSTLKYKSEKYEQDLTFLTDWLHQILGKPIVGFAPRYSEVLGSLADIQRQLMIDGGKNVFQLLDPAVDDDRERVAKKAHKAGQPIEEYIRANNERIESAAREADLPVAEYLRRKNHEVNRRKDVLQVLVVQMAENIHQTKEGRER